MADWAQFAILHLQAAQGKPRLLKAETFETLQTPPPGSEYAGGWMVVDRPWAGGRALTHSGSNTMWYATIWIAPKRDFAVLVATNAGSPGQARPAKRRSRGSLNTTRPPPDAEVARGIADKEDR